MTDEQLIEAMARRLAKDDGANWEAAHFGETPSGETPEEMRDYYRGLATAAVATLRKTHHLIPRAAGDDGELVGRLRYTYEHGIFVAAENGMLAGADEAADAITALSAEVAVAQDYKDCGCSYDHPDDICLGHMKLFERRNAALRAEVERLREALAAYTEYCDICHGRGSIIEEDAVTGADLWRDCPGCTPARAALKENPNAG